MENLPKKEQFYCAYLENFLDMLSAERGASQRTIDAYNRDLINLSCFLKGKSLVSVTEKDLELYVDYLFSSKLAVSTIARRIASMRSFYKFLLSEEEIERDPTEKLRLKNSSLPLPRSLRDETISELLSFDSGCKKNNIFLKASVEVMYGCGLRISELLGLRGCDLSNTGDRFVLFVRGKRGRERVIPIGEAAVEALKDQMKYSSGNPKKPIFCSSRDLNKPASRQFLFLLLKNAANKTNIDPSLVFPHALRHSFAVRIMEAGGDVRVIQEMLGHANISTTQRYTAIARSGLRKSIEKYHPAATDNFFNSELN